jgi:hypothetical protein
VTDTLAIREDDQALVVEVPGRSFWPLFARRFGPPAFAFTLFAAVALIVGFLLGPESPWQFTGAVAGFYSFLMGFVGVMTYRQIGPLARSTELRVDQGMVRLEYGDSESVDEFPLHTIQVLQVSDMALPDAGLRKDTRALVPGNEQYELALVTDVDIEVVAYGVDRDEAQRAVERFEEVASG